MWQNRAVPIALVALILMIWTPSARAHGDLESSRPEKGGHIKRVPGHVSLTLTEPAADARIRVFDGCRRKVAKSPRISGRVVVAPIAKSAEPGRWTVSFRVRSSEDEHLSGGKFSFHVGGKRDCSRQSKEPSTPEPTPQDTPEEVTTEPSDAAGSETEGDSGTPVVGIALGVGVVVAAGLGAKRLLRR